MLLALTFTTGVIDAVSYLGLGRVFTANMTGNVVLLGFALGGAPGFSAPRSLLALGGFALGAVIGGRLARRLGDRAFPWLAAALSGEFVLTLAAAVAALGTGGAAHGAQRTALIVLLSVGLGIRNATVRKLAVPDLTTTVLTMTLTGLAADSPLGGGDGSGSLRRAGAVLSMALGATLGAVMERHGLFGPLLVGAALVLVTQGSYLTHLRRSG